MGGALWRWLCGWVCLCGDVLAAVRQAGCGGAGMRDGAGSGMGWRLCMGWGPVLCAGRRGLLCRKLCRDWAAWRHARRGVAVRGQNAFCEGALGDQGARVKGWRGLCGMEGCPG